MTRDTRDMFDPPDRGRFGDGEHQQSRQRVTGSSDLHDFQMFLHHQTERAILVSDNGEEAKAFWLPKSRCELDRKGKYGSGYRKDGRAVKIELVTVTMPEALAVEKGLL